MVMTRSLLSMSLASLPAVGVADTVYLVPSGEASTTHCLAPVEEGYVSGFDGRYFEVFTVHVTCKEAAHLQPACQQFVQPREVAPPELRPLLVDPATVLVRNTVPLAQVVGIEFQAHYKPQCMVPPMRFRHSPEPIRQPASLFPIVPAGNGPLWLRNLFVRG